MCNYLLNCHECCFCQVAHCYPDIVEDLPHDLITLLHHQGPLLDADMRMVCDCSYQSCIPSILHYITLENYL